MDDLDNPWAASSEPDPDDDSPALPSGSAPAAPAAPAAPPPQAHPHPHSSAVEPTAALHKLSLAAADGDNDDDDGPAWGLDPSSPAAPSPSARADPAPHTAAADPPPALSTALPTETTTSTKPEDADADAEAETVEDPWAPPPWGASAPSPPLVRPIAEPAIITARAPSPPAAPSSPPLFAPASLSLDDDASPWGPPPEPEPAVSPPEASTMTKSALEDTLHKRFADPEAEADDGPAPSHAATAQDPEASTGGSEEPTGATFGAAEADKKDGPPATGGVLSKLKGMMSKSGSATPKPEAKGENVARESTDLAAPMSPTPASRTSASSVRSPASPPAQTAQPAPWLARLKANQKHSRTGSSGDLAPSLAPDSSTNKPDTSPGFKQVTNNAPAAPRGAKSVLSSWLSGAGAKPQVVSAQDDEDDEDDLVSGAAPGPVAPAPVKAPAAPTAGQDLLSFDPEPAKPAPSTGGSWWSNLKTRATSGAGAASDSGGTSKPSTVAAPPGPPTAFGSSDLDWLESASSKPAPTTLLGASTGQMDLLGDTAAHVGEIGYGSSGIGGEAERFAPTTTSVTHESESFASSLLGSVKRKPLSRAEQEKLRSLQMAAASSTGGYRDAYDDGRPAYGTRYNYDDFDAGPAARQPVYSDAAPPEPAPRRRAPAPAANAGASLAPPAPRVSDLLGDLSADLDTSFGDFAQPAPSSTASTALDPFADLAPAPSPRAAPELRPQAPVKVARNTGQISMGGLSWLPPPPGRLAAHGTSGSGRGTPMQPPAAPSAAAAPASSSVADDMKLLADL